MTEQEQSKKLNCCLEMKKFKEELEGLNFTVGDDEEIHGFVYIDKPLRSIVFNDGYKYYPTLFLNYCPFCGTKK